jgi:hypothetical protein
MAYRYETTIFTIASGITKLSKISEIPPGRLLYRGLGGMMLPEQFWREMGGCAVDVKVLTVPGKAEAAAKTLMNCIENRADDFWQFKMSVKVLKMKTHSPSVEQARIVSEAREERNTVYLTVALPVSKFALNQNQKDRLCKDIKACSGEDALWVDIVKVTNWPNTFKGGGGL